MGNDQNSAAINRRQALECMAWGGTGLVWTLSGGVPQAQLVGGAQAAASTFSFVQISDSHVGFDKAANPTPGSGSETASASPLDGPSAAASRPHGGR